MENTGNNSANSHNTINSRTICTLSREEREAVLDNVPRFTEAIRAQAENIIPRKEGRSIRALSLLYDSKPDERDRILKEGHAIFESQLRRIEEEDDPLQIYINYITWMLQMYPEESAADSKIIELLKHTTIKYIDDPRYKDDVRYLKVWLEYASMVPEPHNLFKFLMKQGIGQKLAKFYEHYADFYESTGKFEEANQVYELGIRENAVPLERLKRSHMTFKLKVNERIKRGDITKPKPKVALLTSNFDSNRSTTLQTAASPQQLISPSSLPTINVEQTGYLFSEKAALRAKHAILPYENNNQSSASSSSHITSEQTPLSPSTFRSLYDQPPSRTFRSENQPAAQQLVYKTPTVSTSSPRRPHREPQFALGPHVATSIVTARQRPAKKIKRAPEDITHSPEGSLLAYSKDDSKQEFNRRLERRFAALRSKLYMRKERGRFKEYIHVTAADYDENMSFEEARAKHNEELFSYSTPEEVIAPPELPAVTAETVVREEEQYTEETRAAMQSVNAIITKDSELYHAPDEDDLTWNKPYQIFARPPRRPQTNENEE
ncbi:Mad3/BUB1 homology region 1-domain-containing protein [Mycotypha africana]|uniref:uncharacterized protein n=1 Tax=Mycotypha africana TaxID=64632 RepID=UPI0023016969|nr:uncharacterized protein BDF20DRAFT_831972 [Mycotypha africana]KAI8991976.1 Mad3/BUB1 homology region 1-domain-containing protein [Mycotypha africana]